MLRSFCVSNHLHFRQIPLNHISIFPPRTRIFTSHGFVVGRECDNEFSSKIFNWTFIAFEKESEIETKKGEECKHKRGQVLHYE